MGRQPNGTSGESGDTYGSSLLLPLIGGSGGGGAMGGDNFAGSGGAGGGGAILIASSAAVHIDGTIEANGGQGGNSGGSGCGAVGGAGSGGAIRIIATTITGTGTLQAEPGYRYSTGCNERSTYNVYSSYQELPDGGAGRIRLEAEVNQYTGANAPTYTFSQPGDLFIAGLPTLRIARVAGVEAPPAPTGIADISLPADIANPVIVELEASGIPLGNIVELTLTPQRGSGERVVSTALDGDAGLSTASVAVTLPQGPSTLMASITYTLVVGTDALLDDYARIAGEPVRALRIEAALGGTPRRVLITETGREVVIPAAALAAAG